MIHFFEAGVFIAYSFLAAIITAGGGILVTNVLSLADINLIKAAGLTSSFFLVNAIIGVYIFRNDIVWREVKNLIPVLILGSFIGSIFLVNINPIILLSLMLVFSLYYIYKKIKTIEIKGIQQDSFWREQLIGLFAGSVTGAALPGGGFLNSYFASKGFTLSQMFGTLNFVIIFVWTVKVSVMMNAGILVPSDFIGIAIAFPFLVVTNTLVRKGLIKLSKSTSDKITVLAMSIFSLYALVVIGSSFL
jgi:uncharacterized protein